MRRVGAGLDMSSQSLTRGSAPSSISLSPRVTREPEVSLEAGCCMSTSICKIQLVITSSNIIIKHYPCHCWFLCTTLSLHSNDSGLIMYGHNYTRGKRNTKSQSVETLIKTTMMRWCESPCCHHVMSELLLLLLPTESSQLRPDPSVDIWIRSRVSGGWWPGRGPSCVVPPSLTSESDQNMYSCFNLGELEVGRNWL